MKRRFSRTNHEDSIFRIIADTHIFIGLSIYYKLRSKVIIVTITIDPR